MIFALYSLGAIYVGKQMPLGRSVHYANFVEKVMILRTLRKHHVTEVQSLYIQAHRVTRYMKGRSLTLRLRRRACASLLVVNCCAWKR